MKRKNKFLIAFILFSTIFCASSNNGEPTKFHGWGNTILHHVADSDNTIKGEDGKEKEVTVFHLHNDFNILGILTYKGQKITKHVIMLFTAALVTLILSLLATKKYRKNINAKPKGLSQIFEILMDFINKEMVIPHIGEKDKKTWTPVAMTFFVFILICNLLGLIPFFEYIKWGGGGGSTPTGNFAVTFAFAIITFFAIIIAGVKKHGFIGHWKNMIPGGVPKPVLIILIPIEIIGMLVKPFALTMRLGANMTAGHIGMVAIFALPIILGNGIQGGENYAYLMHHGIDSVSPLSYITGFFAGFVAVLLNTGIYGLELIVSLVQAYVFTLLSCVFIGMAIHADH